MALEPGLPVVIDGWLVLLESVHRSHIAAWASVALRKGSELQRVELRRGDEVVLGDITWLVTSLRADGEALVVLRRRIPGEFGDDEF